MSKILYKRGVHYTDNKTKYENLVLINIFQNPFHRSEAGYAGKNKFFPFFRGDDSYRRVFFPRKAMAEEKAS